MFQSALAVQQTIPNLEASHNSDLQFHVILRVSPMNRSAGLSRAYPHGCLQLVRAGLDDPRCSHSVFGSGF